MGRLIRWLVLILALLALGLGAAYLKLRRATEPQVSGTLPLPGLAKGVVIRREPSGVAHIEAANDHDLFFAQGVVHAQDRLWQMELQRRIGAGRTAELLGEAAVARDRYLRTFGFMPAAQAAYAALSAESRAVIDAYVAGINAYLATRPPLPPEFLLLDVEPEPWTAADVLVWAKVMAYNLADNRRAELRRYRLLARGLTPERIATLLPLYPGERWPQGAQLPEGGLRWGVSDARAIDALLALDDANRQHLPQASNSWVVAGTRTTGGMPLLANDVHLGTQLPATWHLVHLRSPQFDVIGASIPGLPLVLVGRNRHIAWGVTNLAADVEDLYLVEEDGKDRYRHRGATRDYAVRDEEIVVRGGEPVVMRVRETVHGPIISDAADVAGGIPLALRWVGHDPDDTSFDAFLAINRATDWGSFHAALARHVVPAQSFVYADTQGHIGFAAAGRVPRREARHSGLYPVSGNGTWDWRGYLPASEMPWRLDPAEGYLVTANHRVTSDGYPHRISLEWGAEPYRAQRIAERLRGRGHHDQASMRAIQQDTLTPIYRELRGVLLATRPSSEDARIWRARLLTWDGDATTSSPESTLFHAWYGALATLPSAETGEADWGDQPQYLIQALTTEDPACKGQGSSCQEFASRALEEAVARVGRKPHPWGQVHRALLAHTLLTQTPLSVLTDRRVPFGGSPFTVNVGTYDPADWVMYHGATYRQVIDLGAPEDAQFVLAGGQSGSFLSAHYADQIPLWRDGELLPMRLEGYSVGRTLVLLPR